MRFSPILNKGWRFYSSLFQVFKICKDDTNVWEFSSRMCRKKNFFVLVDYQVVAQKISSNSEVIHCNNQQPMTCKSPFGPLERSSENLLNRKQREAERRRKKESYLSLTQRGQHPPKWVHKETDSNSRHCCSSLMQKHFDKTLGNVAADQTLHPAAPGLMQWRG